MSHDGYLIGIDGGTEGIRASIVSLDGREVGQASQSYPTHFPAPGVAEQNPHDWWDALCKVIPQTLAQSGISASEILGVCLDTTCCTVCFLDQAGEPLCPALLWMDVRSNDEAIRVAATGDPALAVNNGGHGPVSAEWMIPKALWAKHNLVECYDRSATICEYQDYLNFRLSGEITASKVNSAVRWHFRHDRGGAPSSLLHALDMPELAEKWPSRILAAGEIVGQIRDRAAQATGLPTGIPVVQGGADAFLAMAGLGVVRSGSMALVTGSSHLQLAVTDQPVSGRGFWGAYADVLGDGTYVVEGGQTSTGSVIRWFRKTLAGGADYAKLDAEAANVPIGCEGLLSQDHFQGNRTPYTDANSRGAVTGLSLNHTRGHVFRSLLESVAFGTRLIVETMDANGVSAHEITACGGVTRSPLWTQIHADVLGKPIAISAATSAPALGSAVFAAIGIGAYADLDEAAGTMSRVESVVAPDPAAHDSYSEIFERYCSLYGALRSVAER